MKDSMFPQPAAVTLNKTQFEKQQIPTFKSNEDSWGISLDNLPPFTIKEIEQHRLKSGKTPESAIIKTLDKERKVECERYISVDTLYKKRDNEYFYVECECKVSMKKDKRRVTVKLNRRNGKKLNQVLAPVLLEIVLTATMYWDYFLKLLLFFTSIKQGSRKIILHKSSQTVGQGGFPGEKYTPKSSIMQTVVKKLPTKRGISSTLHDPRKIQALSVERLSKMKSEL